MQTSSVQTYPPKKNLLCGILFMDIKGGISINRLLSFTLRSLIKPYSKFLIFVAEPIPAAAIDAARPPWIRAQQQRQRPQRSE